MRFFQLLNKPLFYLVVWYRGDSCALKAFSESPRNTAKGELVSLVCSAMLKYLVSRITAWTTQAQDIH